MSEINFEILKKFNAKIVSPIKFEQKDKDGYPIWSFWLDNDKDLDSGADYVLISRLELIRFLEEGLK